MLFGIQFRFKCRIIEVVAKLTESNKYLSTEKKQIDLIARSVSRSSAIEGIRITQKSVRIYLSQPSPIVEKAD